MMVSYDTTERYVEYLLITCLVPEYIHISTQEKLLESDGILVLFNDKRNHWTFMVQYIYLKLMEMNINELHLQLTVG